MSQSSAFESGELQGAIAVAVAAGLAWRERAKHGPLGRSWLEQIREAVPRGYTRDAIDEAIGMGDDATLFDAARQLGNGSGVTAPDTVPICLWVAARRSRHFEEALWETVSALGDRDTTCAIVGGIVALSAGPDSIPEYWLAAREELPLVPPA
jgi:ADP-ribosylglycohydrolase